ncbi:hypothetical protein [Kitasatospora sp. NPDC088346]|uniref:hypothetical protein n=1 Tax=Kitasatospora sp. NPDC088346 TaxID=3364073 RepID=UPI0037F770F0
MAHPVLALGAAALTAAGSTWYLPALADLRAGDDRPRPTRLAAVACLTWWLGTAAAAVLLLTPAVWQLPAAVVLGGAVAGGLLRWTAAAGRSAERRADARRWAALPPGPAPLTIRRRARPVLLAWLVATPAVASAVTAALLLSGRGSLS